MHVRWWIGAGVLLGGMVGSPASSAAPVVVEAAGVVVLSGAGGTVELALPQTATLAVGSTDVPALEVEGGGSLAGVHLTGPDASYVLLRLPEPVDGLTEAAFAAAVSGATDGHLPPGVVSLPAGRYTVRVLADRAATVTLTLGGLAGRVEARTEPTPSRTAVARGTTTDLGAQGVWGAAVQGGVDRAALRFELLHATAAGPAPTVGRYGFCAYDAPPPGDPAYNAAFCYGEDVPNGAFFIDYSGLTRLSLLIREVAAGTQHPGAYGQTTGAVPVSAYAVHWSGR